MFFPFDPYLLRRSAAVLRLPATYVTWQGSAQVTH
jgi:RNA polymerase I-specific transcription initiation factor RRN3